MEALGRFGLTIDPDERVVRLSPVERALLAIVRAFEEIRAECAATGKPGLVLLDEPTPFLPREGVDKLFALMRSIAATGSSVIFISHDIEEVMAITDRITVLRDGLVAGELKTIDATHDQVVESSSGEAWRRTAPVHTDQIETRKPFVRIENLVGGCCGRRASRSGNGEITRPDRPDRLGLRGSATSDLRRKAVSQRNSPLNN